MYVAIIGNTVYVAGGQSGLDLSTAMSNFWRADITKIKERKIVWEILPAWPGPSRAFNLIAAQKNGKTTCIYVISGPCGEIKPRTRTPEILVVKALLN